MPRGDGTGPAGFGPMTGRAAGYCAGYGVPGFTNPISGGGYGGRGRGGGGGRGRRNWFYATGMPGWARAGAGLPAWGGAAYAPAYGSGPYAPAYGGGPYAPGVAPEQELKALKGQTEYLEDALDGIKKRIDEIEAQTAAGKEL